MEVMLIAIAALVVLAFASYRFGADSRPGFRSTEHNLAISGMSWDTTPAAPRQDAATDIRIVMLPTTYSTLAAIDAARGNAGLPFAADADAPYLELRARALADEYWSETVWLTGRVSAARFAAVVDALERERQRLPGKVRVITPVDTSPHPYPAVS